MSPLVLPAAMEPPEARLAPSVVDASPGPRNPVPAAESVTENGVPDWKTVMPLIAQLASNRPLLP